MVLSEIAKGREELPEGVRLRIALDLLGGLDEAQPVEPRSASSRCHFAGVRIDERGRATLEGEGDATGASLLVWEVLATRAAPDESPMPRVHDVVDAIPPDVDDLLAALLSGSSEIECVGDLARALEDAAGGAVGDLDDVREALGFVVLARVVPPLAPSAPGPRRSLTPPASLSFDSRRSDVPPRTSAPPTVRVTPSTVPPPVVEGDAVLVVAQAAREERSRRTSRPPRSSSPPTPFPAHVLLPSEPPGQNETGRAATLLQGTPLPLRAVVAPPHEPTSDDDLLAWGFLSRPPPAEPPPESTSKLPRATPSVWDFSDIDPGDDATAARSEVESGIRSSAFRTPTPPPKAPIALQPLVLLVKVDEDENGPLATMVRGAGYSVITRSTAEGGMQAAAQVLPDVIVVDFDLPDEPGDLLVRRLRNGGLSLAATPIVLLTSPADTRTRVARFATGADVCILKPPRFGDIVGQIAALVKMQSRLRSAREALPYISSTGDKVFAGDLAQISISAMLTILEMERRSGVFDVICDMQRVQLEIVAGRMTAGVALDEPIGPLATLRIVLRWTYGHFSFRTIPLRAPPPDARTITELLGEALRLQDEEDHPNARVK